MMYGGFAHGCGVLCSHLNGVCVSLTIIDHRDSRTCPLLAQKQNCMSGPNEANSYQRPGLSAPPLFCVLFPPSGEAGGGVLMRFVSPIKCLLVSKSVGQKLLYNKAYQT